MHPLRLGLFTFRNDDVLLLVGTRQAISDLAQRLEQMIEHGQLELRIHDQALVSQKHPAKLVAFNAAKGAAPCEEFSWPVNEAVIEELRTLGARSNEQYFPLSRPHQIFQVNCGSHYNAQWWETYA